MNYNLITILGPTAVGKTKLAANLAAKFQGEIISADSRQVYKGMDIGTGKDLADYKIESTIVPYHLIDVISPLEEFDLYKFNEHFYESFDVIRERGKLPFLVGGTGLYIHSILRSYSLPNVDFNSPRAKELSKKSFDELKIILKSKEADLHNTTDLLDRERTIKAILITETDNAKYQSNKINSFNVGVYLPREKVKERITERLKYRLENGMIEEVEKLLQDGVLHEKLQIFGLEYKFVSLYLKNELNYNDMFQKLNSAIHQFSKRQMTWFRKMEKEGVAIHWLDGAGESAAEELIKQNFEIS